MCESQILENSFFENGFKTNLMLVLNLNFSLQLVKLYTAHGGNLVNKPKKQHLERD